MVETCGTVVHLRQPFNATRITAAGINARVEQLVKVSTATQSIIIIMFIYVVTKQIFTNRFLFGSWNLNMFFFSLETLFGCSNDIRLWKFMKKKQKQKNRSDHLLRPFKYFSFLFQQNTSDCPPGKQSFIQFISFVFMYKKLLYKNAIVFNRIQAKTILFPLICG